MITTKYWGEFRDLYNRVCRVEIRGEGGISKEIEFDADPVVVRYSKKEITEPIFSSGCTLRVLSQTDYQFADLFTAAEKAHEVRIYVAGNPVFFGFIEATLYQEEFITPPYVVEIPCSDGLASLDDYYPTLTSDDNKVTLYSIIKACLSETALSLPINICCSLLGYQHASSSVKTLFEQTFTDLSGLYEEKDGAMKMQNAKDLLTSVLQPFGCRVFQARGEWYVERIKNKFSDTPSWVKFPVLYPASGSPVAVSTPADHIRVIGDGDVHFYSVPTLQINAGYGEQVLKIEHKRHATVILNNYASIASLPGSIYEAQEKVWFKSTNLLVVAPVASTGGIKNGVSLQHDAGAPVDRCIIQRARVSMGNGDKMTIAFDFNIVKGTQFSESQNIAVLLSVSFGGAKSIAADGAWTSGANHQIQITKELSEWKGDFTNPIRVSLTSKEWSFGAYRQEVVVRLYCSLQGSASVNPYRIENSLFGNVSLTVEENDKTDNVVTAKVNRKYMRRAPDMTVKFYDVPRISLGDGAYGANHNYANALTYRSVTSWPFDYDPLTSWYDKSYQTASSGRAITDRLLLDNFDLYYDSRDILSGDIITAERIDPTVLFTVVSRSGKKYQLTALDYDLASSQHKTTIEEIKGNNVAIA